MAEISSAEMTKLQKADKDLDNKFNALIAKLASDDVDKYDVNDLFDKGVHLVYPDNVDGDITNMMLDTNIQDATGYIDELEDDVSDCKNHQRKIDLENDLAFVENNFTYHGLRWYVGDTDTHLDFLDQKTAIKGLKILRNSASVF